MAKNFAAMIEKLDQLVAKMEQGDLSLEQALEHFEQGVKLCKQCQTALSEAELKVQRLMEDGQTLDDFEVAHDDD